MVLTPAITISFANIFGALSTYPVQASMDTNADSFNSILPELSYTLSDLTMYLGITSFTLDLFYVFLALPSVQAIISERDDQLANGIISACELVSEKKNLKNMAIDDYMNGKPSGRVVALLGILHINGVAARMMMSEYDDMFI